MRWLRCDCREEDVIRSLSAVSRLCRLDPRSVTNAPAPSHRCSHPDNFRGICGLRTNAGIPPWMNALDRQLYVALWTRVFQAGAVGCGTLGPRHARCQCADAHIDAGVTHRKIAERRHKTEKRTRACGQNARGTAIETRSLAFCPVRSRPSLSMSTELVEKEIARFLASPDAEVLCLRGKWGVGKTYSWNEFLKQAQRQKRAGAARTSPAFKLIRRRFLQAVQE